MARHLSRTLLTLLLLAGPLACVTAPPTPQSRAEADVRPKAEFLCQHELLFRLVPTRFPEDSRPEDYVRREDLDFFAAHPEWARTRPLDKPGLPEELSRYVRCEVKDVRAMGDAVSVTLRRTMPRWEAPRFNLEALAQAATREEARALLERWNQQGPELATQEHRVFFTWTGAGWRVAYWLPERVQRPTGSVDAPRSPLAPQVYSEAMTPPKPLSAPKVGYTREALDNGVQGLMVVQCVINREGVVGDCHILKPLPYLNEPVLRALQASRYTPVLFKGEPVNVDYTFNLVFMLPNR